MDDGGIKFWLSLLADEGGDFLGAATGTTSNWVLLGFAAAVGTYVLFRLVRILSKTSPGFAKIGLGLWLLIFLPMAFGFIGFQKGLTKAVGNLITEGRIAQEVMPEVGGGVSWVVFLVDDALAQQLDGIPAPAEDAPPREELDVAVFLDRSSRATDAMIDKTLPAISEYVKERSTTLSEGIGEEVFDWFLKHFGEELIREQVDEEVEGVGVGSPVRRWFIGLPDAAAEEGDDSLIGRGELGAYTIETTLTSFFLAPLQLAADFQIALGWGAVALIVILPAIGLIAFRWVLKNAAMGE